MVSSLLHCEPPPATIWSCDFLFFSLGRFSLSVAFPFRSLGWGSLDLPLASFHSILSCIFNNGDRIMADELELSLRRGLETEASSFSVTSTWILLTGDPFNPANFLLVVLKLIVVSTGCSASFETSWVAEDFPSSSDSSLKSMALAMESACIG